MNPVEIEGFTFVADDVYEFGDAMEMLPVYRFDRFSDALELGDERDKAVEFVLLPKGHLTSGFTAQQVEAWRSWFDDSAALEPGVTEFEIGSFLIARAPLVQKVLDATFPELEFIDQRNVEGPDVPVHGISFETARELAADLGLSLPTGAQWEYACRAGSTTEFHFGNAELLSNEYGWYQTVSPMGVGQKRTNLYGLYDIVGNIWEWCTDDIEEPVDEDSNLVDQTWTQPLKMMRGGAWNQRNVLTLMSSFVTGAGPLYTGPDVGVRFVFDYS